MTVTLEEMAQAIEAKRQEVDAAREKREELKEPFQAAVDELQRVKGELAAMVAAMAGVKAVDAIERGLADAGIDYEGPRVVTAKVYSGHDYYKLVAVGSQGTGLYLVTPERSRRHIRKEHAIRRLHADAHGVDEERDRRPHWYGHTSTSQRDAGLLSWEEQGAGSFGARSGAFKPSAPPEGGRWRWLKVREQEELKA